MKFFYLLIVAVASAQAQAGQNVGDRLQQLMPELSRQSPTNISANPIDWAQPPLGCVEEMAPKKPDRPCLDLSAAANPFKDWPADISPSDKDFWYSHRRPLTYCRAAEVMRREAAQPGSQAPTFIELAWMILQSIENADQKIAAVYEANRLYGIPVHVLTGALFQESLFAELGIADDGGNFSCGLSQINLSGWCNWANNQSPQDKQAMNWPSSVNCSDPELITLDFVKPFYEIAKTRLNGLPTYRLQPEHFQNITLDNVKASWPTASDATLQKRYQIVRSFIDNCSNGRKSILAAANELTNTYSEFVPQSFKNKDRYQSGDHFKRSCKMNARGNAYPLHSGWLLAVASYNAGPRAIEALAFYNQWDRAAIDNPATLIDFTPDQIIPSLYWAGKYNPFTDKIDFKSLAGGDRSWIWFKGCVVQRHVARVMQHVTLLPEFFVDTLEGNYPCAKSVFENGKLVKTSVPPFRQTSSGIKATP